MVRFVLRLLAAGVALLLACGLSIASSGPSRMTADSKGGYTLVLVDAADRDELLEARDFITSQGGSIAVVLPPNAIMGWINPEADNAILGRHHISSIFRTTVASLPSKFRDRETQMVVNAFNDIVSGRNARRRLRESQQPTGPASSRPGMIDCSLPHPSVDKDNFIRNLRLLGSEQSVLGIQSTVTPQFLSNTDTMDGSVAVAVFLVESAGGIDQNLYSWSQADQDSAFSQVLDGLNWWVEQSRAFGLARPLQFTMVRFAATHPACQIPYEPVLRSGNDAPLWVNQIMSNVGATAGNVFERVGAFDRSIRDQNHADWAFSMFIAYNPSPARTSFADGRASWAYIGGPFTVSLFHSFGWQLSRIVSHETGHIFYACDEYLQIGYQTCSCTCAPEVRPDALNGNCQDLACTRNSTECMMRINESALCAFTVAQIGWTSAVPKPVPSAPSGLVASSNSPTQVTLVWQDTSAVEDGFQIERRGGTSAEYSQIGLVSFNATTFVDSTVLANTAYAYRVKAFNATGASPFSNETTVITPATPSALSVGTADMPDATVGVSYSRTLSALGGTPDFTWRVENGSIPPGMSLSQAGSVAGIPTTAGTFTFVVRVTDSRSGSATKALTLVVRSVAPLTITSTQLPRGSVGSTYSQSVGASGGQTPYTWTMQSGSLPDGLSLNQNGIISGTPERAGTASFVLKLTDAVSASVTTTLSIIVNPPVLVFSIDTASLPDGVVGQTYSQTLAASGGSGPYRWELRSGKLPDGLVLSEAGVISGTPTASGEQTFEIRATDQSGQSIVKTLSLDVDPPPELTILSPSALPVAAVGVPYRFEFKATAGTAPYSWAKKKKKKFGTLPDGLSLSSDGVLSGTPTTEGTSNFTVQVVDSVDRLARKPSTLEVGPPPPPLSIRTESLPQAPLGLPYNARLEGSGGVSPYTWNIDGGALPDGLALNSDGLISGRPTTIGSISFVAKVKDAVGTSSTKNLFLTVIPPPAPLVILTVSLPDTTAERPYSQSLTAAGGLPPYSWSIASGSLGPGLNLSADGMISGTPTTPGTSVFVVRVTDNAAQTITKTLAIAIKPSDKFAPFGVIETPSFQSTITNLASGSGWALDNVGVTQIDVLVDGQKVGEAIYGLNRPDIAAVWSSFPNALHSGFSFQIDTTRLSLGDHTLAVRLLDAGGNSAIIGSRLVTVQNNIFTIVTTSLPSGRRTDFYDATLQTANGHPPITWELVSGSLPTGISLNASGRISGTPSVFGTFPFTVRATDSTGLRALASLSLRINSDVEQFQIISAGELAAGTTGVDYSQQLLFAGGVPPRVWSLNAGTLPNGLSIGPSSGVISGVPTNVGTFNFIVRLSDATGASVVSSPLQITISPGPLVFVTSGTLTRGTVGSSYTQALTAKGGAPPFTWTLASGTLPVGLLVNPSTGVISGVPGTGQYGTFTFTVRVTDSQTTPVNATSGTLTIIVDPAPLAIVSGGDLPNGKLNTDYSQTLVATGGRSLSPYTWALAPGSGPLPTGLTLNAATGVISGRPTATGQFSFTVTVTDVTPTTATSVPIRITVNP